MRERILRTSAVLVFALAAVSSAVGADLSGQFKQRAPLLENGRLVRLLLHRIGGLRLWLCHLTTPLEGPSRDHTNKIWIAEPSPQFFPTTRVVWRQIGSSGVNVPRMIHCQKDSDCVGFSRLWTGAGKVGLARHPWGATMVIGRIRPAFSEPPTIAGRTGHGDSFPRSRTS